MAKAEWRDSTSYSQGERGTVTPRAWTYGDDHRRSLILWLSRGETDWHLTVYALGIEKPLGTSDLEKAKQLAFREVEKALEGFRSYYEKLGVVAKPTPYGPDGDGWHA